MNLALIEFNKVLCGGYSLIDNFLCMHLVSSCGKQTLFKVKRLYTSIVVIDTVGTVGLDMIVKIASHLEKNRSSMAMGTGSDPLFV